MPKQFFIFRRKELPCLRNGGRGGGGGGGAEGAIAP